MQLSTDVYLNLALALFAIGSCGVLWRRNALIVLMSIELMLNAANLVFIAAASAHRDLDGQIYVFMSMAMAAAESAVGLALIVRMYRVYGHVNLAILNQFRDEA
jgi:NADH-quinone oxidoreductase subunit K